MVQVTISQIQNASLITGITYNIQPQNSGQLDCGGKTISGNDYIKYKFDSEVNCIAYPNSEFEFESWSADLKLNSDSKPQTNFKSTGYGNITANFLAPVVLIPQKVTGIKFVWL